MTSEDSMFAFVLMPFSKRFEDIYQLGVKETASNLGIRAERVDEQMFREGILERIYRQIDLADIIIADMSGQNANVFYEVGYAHAKEKLCILMTCNAGDIPFDLKHTRHIIYGDSIEKLRQYLGAELQWAKNEVNKLRRSGIRIEPKEISGLLTKSQWYATAKLTFLLDLHIEEGAPPTELENIYFYSGKDWKIQQEGKECGTTQSDCTPYNHRYLIDSPIRRLDRSDWAQLRFTAERVVAWALSGDELSDSYEINGNSMLRLVTNRGNFDYDIPVAITVDSLPF